MHPSPPNKWGRKWEFKRPESHAPAQLTCREELTGLFQRMGCNSGCCPPGPSEGLSYGRDGGADPLAVLWPST